MLRNPEFDSKEVDPDLHKRMQKAVEDGHIKCFDLLKLIRELIRERSPVPAGLLPS